MPCGASSTWSPWWSAGTARRGSWPAWTRTGDRSSGSLEGILAALDGPALADAGFPAGARTKLAAARDYLAAAPLVVQVARDVPVPAYDDTLPTEPAAPDRLVELCDRWRLDSPVNRLLNAFASAHTQ